MTHEYKQDKVTAVYDWWLHCCDVVCRQHYTAGVDPQRTIL